MISLEYVMSGFGHTKSRVKKFHIPEAQKTIHRFIGELNSSDSHTFSILFNAFIEPGFGDFLQEFEYHKAVDKIHADSGGLQMVTQGKIIDEATKNAVYTTQGKYSDVGMAFDEIPLVIVDGEKSKVGDTSTRRFDNTRVRHYAELSADNVADQIRHFHDMGSDRCKPYVIIHGNDEQTFKDFAGYMSDRLPADLHQHIGGLSVSAASHGNGVREHMERAMLLNEMPFDTRNFHLLGVGSFRSMTPYIGLSLSGYYKDDMHLSYDSTTDSASISRMQYVDGMSRKSLGMTHSPEYDKMYDRVCARIPFTKEFVSDGLDFYNTLNSIDGCDEKDPHKYIATRWSMLTYNVLQLKDRIDATMRSKKKYEKTFGQAPWASIAHNITQITDRQQYQEFVNTSKSSLKSVRIKKLNEDSLSSFF